MKLYVYSLLGVLASVSPVMADACNNNCGHDPNRFDEPSMEQRIADCYSFLLATVTPNIAYDIAVYSLSKAVHAEG